MERPPTQELYLDLLKKTLSFTLWPEPSIPIDTFNYTRPFLKRFIVSLISRILGLKHLQLVRQQVFTTEQREEGQIWPGYADTMIGLKRLDNLQFCIGIAIREGIEGDFIETGVCRSRMNINTPLIKVTNIIPTDSWRFLKMRLRIILGDTVSLTTKWYF